MFACFPIGAVNVVINDEADLASATGTLGPYFHLLGVPAALGRTLTVDDDKPGATAVAVISHAFWRKRFGSDPNVVGRSVTINNQPFSIVGVTPASFKGIQRLGVDAPDVTLSMSLESQLMVGQSRFTQPTNWYVQIVGRLKPGVTADQVRANLEGVFHSTARAGMDGYMSALTPEQRALSTNRREKFAVPRLLVLPASRWHLRLRQPGGADHQDPRLGRRCAAVARVRERRDAAAVAGDRPAKRDLDPSLHGRVTAPADSTTADRESGPFRARRIARDRRRLLEPPVAAVRPERAARLARLRVRRWAEHVHRRVVRPRPRIPHDAGRSGERDEGRKPKRRRLEITAEQEPARAPGGAFAGAAHRCRLVSQDGQQSPRRQHRLQSEQSADVLAEPRTEPLRH